VVDAQTVEQMLALGHETRAFEVKRPARRTDKQYCAIVARAAMAMGNLRDGGLVCLGIDDDKVASMQPGLTPELVREWSDFDNVHAAVDRFSDPPVDFDLHALTLGNGVEVVVMEVREFLDNPHLCRRQYPEVLVDGMAYVRPRGKPQSVPVPSSVEMRELLDLAITKGVREFVRRAGGSSFPWPTGPEPTQDDVASFQREYAEMWADPSAILQQIQSSGYCDVTVRPTDYLADRLTPNVPETFVADQAVRMRGWPLPYVDQREPIRRRGWWVGQDFTSERVPHVEAWRMSVSSQFLHRRVLATDTRHNDQLRPSNPDATGAVAVWDVLLYLVEVSELGARMGTVFELPSISFETSLRGISGRQLIAGDFGRELPEHYLVAADTLTARIDVATPALLEDPRAIGVALTQRLLQQFGLSVPDQLLDEWQDQVFGRSSHLT
jgi:hypothetical protein